MKNLVGFNEPRRINALKHYFLRVTTLNQRNWFVKKLKEEILGLKNQDINKYKEN